MIPDLTGDKELTGDFSVPPPGDYVLRVDSASEAPAQTGAPMVSVSWRVVGGEHAGGIVRDNFVLNNPTGRGRLKGLLGALGLPAGGIDAQRLVGRLVEATVKNESFAKRDGSQAVSAKPTSFRCYTGSEAAAPAQAPTAIDAPF